MFNFCRKLKTGIASCAVLLATGASVSSHPHVFIEASLEIVRNEKGQFSELRHVWRFDELFSSTIIIDFDANANGKLDPEELEEVTTTVKASIEEYDFYTAMRSGKDVIEFYPPEKINGYIENGQMIMFLSLEPAEPRSFDKGPIRISASDTSYYVAFEIKDENVKISGKDATSCKTVMSHPDFDKLYAENSQTLSDAYFNEQENKPLDLGDEFYSWASITC